MRRSLALVGLMAAGLFLATPEPARADSLFGFHFGGFIPKGLESRDINTDVLRQNTEFWDYNYRCDRSEPLQCFNGLSFSGEYLVGFGDWIEAGVSVGYYSKSVEAVYFDFTDTDGSEIESETTFKNIPVAVTVRAFPIGRTTPVQPYVGGGIAIQRWGYKEAGEFIDFTPGGGRPIFVDEYDDKGTAVGPTVLFGVRAPLGNAFFVGGEARWTSGKAKLHNEEFNFAGDELELGGWNVMAGFHVKF